MAGRLGETRGSQSPEEYTSMSARCRGEGERIERYPPIGWIDTHLPSQAMSIPA